jgi:Acyl-CoA carboxylase epsilon subunit
VSVRVASIAGNPTPEEVVAITVAVTALGEQLRAEATAAPGAPADVLNLWVEASRRAAQRSGMQRGPWRISGRIARRSRL